MDSTMQTGSLLISGLLRHGSTVHADSEVVTWTGEGSRRMTYAQVGQDAARLAHALRGLGITGDQRVATFMWNNAEHLVAYLAIPSMGAVLHAWNIRLAPGQLVYIGNHSEAQVVLVDNTLAASLAKLLPRLQHVRHVIVNGDVDDETRAALGAPAHVEAVHDYAALLAEQPSEFDWPEDIDEQSASSMCYTSGTTGNPKGVAYSHRSNVLHALGVAVALPIASHDSLLTVVPLFHANAWGFPYVAMVTGTTLMMPDRFLQGDPLSRFIRTEGITKGAGVPTVWSDLLRSMDADPEAARSLEHLVVGGSAAPRSLIQGFEERHDVTVLHAWGMTETSPVGSAAEIRPKVEPRSEEYWARRASQGKIVFGVEGRLVGPTGDALPWDGDAVGELEIRGPWITGSYYTNGTESEEEVADFADKFDEGWLRTGDVGTISPGGYLHLTDRAKDVIKSGGEWISSVELENALMAHSAVIEASVVGVPDERWGERPLATIVVREGAEVTADELREFLRATIPSWQLPDRWSFIDEVPKTSVGKFDKKALRGRYADGSLQVTEYDAPGTKR